MKIIVEWLCLYCIIIGFNIDFCMVKKKSFVKWLKMYFIKYVFIMSVKLFLGFKFSFIIYYFDVCFEKIYFIVVGISLDFLG